MAYDWYEQVDKYIGDIWLFERLKTTWVDTKLMVNG
jgi:hypothetical protein